MNDCKHDEVICVNPFELIRKYRCLSYKEIMMCDCEQEFATRFLPHQIRSGTWLDTQQQAPVTLGFQPNICNSCKGLKEEAHPKAEIFGYSSKIKRYYWRELYFETTNMFYKWSSAKGYSDMFLAQHENETKYKEIEQKALAKIKKLHETNPKYSYNEESQADAIANNQVEIIDLSAKYSSKGQKGKLIIGPNGIVSPEQFASQYFRNLGYETLEVESVPFHVLFGVYMWFVIQDSGDPLQQKRGFGDRNASENNVKGETIWVNLPTDFGTSGYRKRRFSAIEDHFEKMLPKDKLIKVFNLWLKHSENLRQYLWAHREKDIEKARKIVEVLPAEVIRKILKYLVEDYWRRYLGWPDLLVFNGNEYCFVEVKSSRDKLNEDQKRWIKDNNSILKLPYKLVKIHKTRD